MLVTYELAALPYDVPGQRALSGVITQLRASKRVVVITGAGVSCSSGIPDFRSSRGMYHLTHQHGRAMLKGSLLFDASVFSRPESTAEFLSMIAKLKKLIDQARPSSAHYLIDWLRRQNRLLRGYTQNFDGLEALTGLRCSATASWLLSHLEVDIIQLHGSIHYVYCTVCSARYPYSQVFDDSFVQGESPECPQCIARRTARIERRARPTCIGGLRPAVVLNNEAHPEADEIAAVCAVDLSQEPDLLLIMGTSLKSHGVKQVVKAFSKAVRSSTAMVYAAQPESPRVIFVNKTAPPAEWRSIIDVHFLGDIDEWVSKVLPG